MNLRQHLRLPATRFARTVRHGVGASAILYRPVSEDRAKQGCQRMERQMSDAPDNLMLVYLRRIDEKLDRLADSVADLSRRVTSLETKVALLHGDFAAQSERIDRVVLRLDRIERRMDIVPA